MIEESKTIARYCKYPNSPASMSDVAELEMRLQVKLPKDYVAYLTTWNGGVFRSLSMQTPLGSDDELDTLFGVGAGVEDEENLGNHSHLNLFEDNWPIVFLPIGRSLLNHLLLMDFSSDSHGAIWIKKAWDSQGFLPWHPSFSDFLRAIVEGIEPT